MRSFLTATAVVFAVVLPGVAYGQVLRSPDDRYRAEAVRKGTDVQYQVYDVEANRLVLITRSQYPTPNDAKAARFSSDATRFSVVFHYGHLGRYSWFGVWSTAEGRFLYERTKSGWTTDFEGVFDEATAPPRPVAAPAVAQPSRPATSVKKGVAYTSWQPGEYSSPRSDITLSGLIAPMGVDWLSVLVTCYQKTVASSEILCGPDVSTPTDDDLRHVIGFAQGLGMQVMLKPHVDLSGDPGRWRGQIDLGDDEAGWTSWFSSYTAFITHFADLAQRTGVDLFAVGTELEGTSHREEQWRGVVRRVKEVYAGPLTYGANWTEAPSVRWFDAVDVIGIDAYYPLTLHDEPSLADLRAAWRPIVSDLDDLSRKWNRQILFTEIGYRSINGSNRRPHDYQMTGIIDLQEQADCYQAAFEAFDGLKWFDGFMWWNWTPNPSQGGTLDSDYTATGKPAESVLRKFYTFGPLRAPSPSQGAMAG